MVRVRATGRVIVRVQVRVMVRVRVEALASSTSSVTRSNCISGWGEAQGLQRAADSVTGKGKGH